jgi:hypothetical protein
VDCFDIYAFNGLITLLKGADVPLPGHGEQDAGER